jgi:hypothetical protein
LGTNRTSICSQAISAHHLRGVLRYTVAVIKYTPRLCWAVAGISLSNSARCLRHIFLDTFAKRVTHSEVELGFSEEASISTISISAGRFHTTLCHTSASINCIIHNSNGVACGTPTSAGAESPRTARVPPFCKQLYTPASSALFDKLNYKTKPGSPCSASRLHASCAKHIN